MPSVDVQRCPSSNRGPVVAAKDLGIAIYATEELEETARLYLLLRGMNPRILSSAQIDDLVIISSSLARPAMISQRSPPRPPQALRQRNREMRRISANLGFLFLHLPLVERIGAAAAAGFEAVEMHWPYDVPPHNIKAALAQNNIPVLALNTPVGDAAAGDFGLAALPGRSSEFRQAFDTALSYGAEIGASAIHCMAGVVPTEQHAAAEKTFVENLKAASEKAEHASTTLLLEPIDHRDKPGYFLHDVEQAAAIIDKVGVPISRSCSIAITPRSCRATSSAASRSIAG